MSDGDVDLRAVFETLDPKARDKLRRVLVNDLIDFLVLHKEERRPFHQHSGWGREAKDAPRRPMEEQDVLREWIRGLEGSISTR